MWRTPPKLPFVDDAFHRSWDHCSNPVASPCPEATLYGQAAHAWNGTSARRAGSDLDGPVHPNN